MGTWTEVVEEEMERWDLVWDGRIDLLRDVEEVDFLREEEEEEGVVAGRRESLLKE